MEATGYAIELERSQERERNLGVALNAAVSALRDVQPMLRAMSMLTELDEKDCAAIRTVEAFLATRKE